MNASSHTRSCGFEPPIGQDSGESNEKSADLLDRWRRDGDEGAAEEIFGRYVGRLTALARSRLSSRLARRIDPEDVVLSAWRSFFVGAREGQFSLRRNGDLWRLLAAITMHKLCRQAQRHTSGKRAMGREQNVSLEIGLDAAAAARGPGPEHAAALADELERILSDLDPLERRILELRLQGERIADVAGDVGRSERTVRRILKGLEALFVSRLATD